MWYNWTGGSVPLELEDTVLHHKSRMTPISPPPQHSDRAGSNTTSAETDMPLYAMCFSGRNPKRFISTEISLQLRISEKKYFQGFVAHNQLPVSDPEDEEYFDSNPKSQSQAPTQYTENSVQVCLFLFSTQLSDPRYMLFPQPVDSVSNNDRYSPTATAQPPQPSIPNVPVDSTQHDLSVSRKRRQDETVCCVYLQHTSLNV